MRTFGRALAVAALSTVASAAPPQLQSRSVSSGLFHEMTLFAEYSAAAYCGNNLNSVAGTKLTCTTGICPLVQSATTVALAEFDESCSFGDVAGFIAADETNHLIVLSFRGSRTLSNWIADLDFVLWDAGEICSGCWAHDGFLESWRTVQSMVTAEIEAAVAKYPGYQLVFTGHSLGGAIATLAAATLRQSGYNIQLYTYGSPRVGNLALAEFITSQGNIYRATHENDIVPKLPPMSFGFSHPSPEYWITSGDALGAMPADVQVIQGIDSTAGNAGSGGDSISAHDWYIINIDGC